MTGIREHEKNVENRTAGECFGSLLVYRFTRADTTDQTIHNS